MLLHKESSTIFATATSGRYTQEVTVSFVADVSDKQSAWERSGKFEGDIMLTDEQKRNGLINTARRWPTRRVPFFIDISFSEYCGIRLQSGLWGVEVIIHALCAPL